MVEEDDDENEKLLIQKLEGGDIDDEKIMQFILKNVEGARPLERAEQFFEFQIPFKANKS